MSSKAARWQEHYQTEAYLQKSWERFNSYMQIPETGSCVNWLAYVSEQGYGTFSFRKKVVKAHRWIYELEMGPIPEGTEIDHLCRNRACVNVNHLEAVTHQENVLRGEGLAAKEARQTHCPHGHEYTSENTSIRRRPDGSFKQRVCLACKRDRWHRVEKHIPRKR